MCQKVNNNYFFLFSFFCFSSEWKVFIHNLDVRFFIQFFHPFILLYFYFFPKLDENFHLSMIFNKPYLPHMSSKLVIFAIIKFILASFTQQWARQSLLGIVILGVQRLTFLFLGFISQKISEIDISHIQCMFQVSSSLLFLW